MRPCGMLKTSFGRRWRPARNDFGLCSTLSKRGAPGKSTTVGVRILEKHRTPADRGKRPGFLLPTVIPSSAGDCGRSGHAWDLLILNIAMPGRSGFDILRDLKQLRPELPVLVLSLHPEDLYAKRVLRAGAAGYLNKETPEELVKATRKVLAGSRYVSAALAEKLASDLSAEVERPHHERLSDREFEVLRMIGAVQDSFSDRGRAALERAHCEHLSRTHPGEDGPEKQR